MLFEYVSWIRFVFLKHTNIFNSSNTDIQHFLGLPKCKALLPTSFLGLFEDRYCDILCLAGEETKWDRIYISCNLRWLNIV